MTPLTKVTLKGGLKAGDFTDVGKVGKLSDCYDICCRSEKCDLAFMLGQNCFSVKCYNQDLCQTIPAQPSIFNPQIAYVASREKISLNTALEGKIGCAGKNLLKVVKFQNLVENVMCRKYNLIKFANFLIVVRRAEIVTTFGTNMVTTSTHNTKT